MRSVVRAKALAKRIRQEQQMSLRGLADAEDGKSGKDLSVRGVFSVSHARLFATPKAVVWQCSGAAIGALVCEKHVNILLAANQLGLVLTVVSKLLRSSWLELLLPSVRPSPLSF